MPQETMQATLNTQACNLCLNTSNQVKDQAPGCLTPCLPGCSRRAQSPGSATPFCGTLLGHHSKSCTLAAVTLCRALNQGACSSHPRPLRPASLAPP
jgi:hypothetical protein